MIASLIAAAALSTSQSCPAVNSGDRLVEELALPITSRRLAASTYLEPGLGTFDIHATLLVVRTSNCDVLFEQEFEGSHEIKLTTVTLGATPMLIATALSQGGSGCGLEHALLIYDEDGVRPLAPTSLGHSNMGGLYVGNLGGKKGPGLVLFEAEWTDGNHYDPHPYRVLTYRWDDRSFIGPMIEKTKPMPPNPEQVAATLGYTISKDLSFDC